MTFLKKSHWIGIISSILILIVNIIFFRGENLFYFLIGISVAVAALPFVLGTIVETAQEKEKNEQFLEFTRALAEM